MVAKKSILIVEDQPDLMSLLSVLLTSRGYTVNGVADGNAALAYLTENRPDLVLLDIMLPGVDGFEICRNIKSNQFTCHIPVIFLTAKNDRMDFAKAEAVGADEYIVKPFKAEIFIETVRKVLDGAL